MDVLWEGVRVDSSVISVLVFSVCPVAWLEDCCGDVRPETSLAVTEEVIAVS